MILKYDNHPCPCCGRPLSAEDDVVVCPVCATPHHRECWMANGHCINENLHESGYVWSANEKKKEKPVENAQAAPSDSVICHICGSENPANSRHCGNCGTFFGEPTQSENGKKICGFCGKENDGDAIHCKNCGAPFGGIPIFNNNPYIAGTTIAHDELIGGIKAEDMAFYTQASIKKYLPKFKSFANGKKFSFNFAAFFFAPYWFFFRKLHKVGIFFIALFVTASLMLSGYSADLVKASNEYASVIYGTNIETATAEELAEFEKELEKASNDYLAKIKIPMLIVTGVNVVIRLICALFADKLYYNKMRNDIKLIDETVEEPNMRKMMISRKGGLSPLAFAVSIMGYNSLVQLLVSGAEMIMNNF